MTAGPAWTSTGKTAIIDGKTRSLYSKPGEPICVRRVVNGKVRYVRAKKAPAKTQKKTYRGGGLTPTCLFAGDPCTGVSGEGKCAEDDDDLYCKPGGKWFWQK